MFTENSAPAYNKRHGFVKYIILAIVGILALIILSSSMISVKQDEYVLVKQFGKVVNVIDTAGLSFKIPFIQSIDRLPRNIQLYDMQASDIITKDKKAMILDNYVLWEISDPLKFYQTLNTLQEGERRIETIVFNALKNYMSSMNQADVITGRTNGITSDILPGIEASFDGYGINVRSVEIKRLDLPDDNKASVYTRMISERSQVAASYTAEGQKEAQIIINDTDKQTSIIRSEANAKAQQIIAEGESEYMKILSEAYASSERLEFYEFMRSLDALKVSMVGNNKTLILPIDSPLTRILLGYK